MSQFQIEDAEFVRNNNVGASMIAKFPFDALAIDQRFFVPDATGDAGKRVPLPVKAANAELYPKQFKVRNEVRVTTDENGNQVTVKGRYVYRVADAVPATA